MPVPSGPGIAPNYTCGRERVAFEFCEQLFAGQPRLQCPGLDIGRDHRNDIVMKGVARRPAGTEIMIVSHVVFAAGKVFG